MPDTDRPLKRPPTSGTRRGNGPGLGGPAKGASVFGSTGMHAERGDAAEAWDADTVPPGGRADNDDADEQAYRQYRRLTRAARREREEEVSKWRRTAEKVLISAMIQSTKAVDKIAAAGTLARILPQETRQVIADDVPEDSAERARELEALLFDIAMNGRPEDTVRIAAANAALDRIKGRPVQATITANVDDAGSLTDEQLRSELARLSGTSGGSAAGDGAPPLPD